MNEKRFGSSECTGHLKKSFTQDYATKHNLLINDRWINEKIEKLRRLKYSNEHINRKLGHLINWRI